jgi:hypothetical protein
MCCHWKTKIIHSCGYFSESIKDFFDSGMAAAQSVTEQELHAAA